MQCFLCFYYQKKNLCIEIFKFFVFGESVKSKEFGIPKKGCMHVIEKNAQKKALTLFVLFMLEYIFLCNVFYVFTIKKKLYAQRFKKWGLKKSFSKKKSSSIFKKNFFSEKKNQKKKNQKFLYGKFLCISCIECKNGSQKSVSFCRKSFFLKMLLLFNKMQNPHLQKI